nr:MAG TPA: hypothetical protein [Caudoviricetes sp.]
MPVTANAHRYLRPTGEPSNPKSQAFRWSENSNAATHTGRSSNSDDLKRKNRPVKAVYIAISKL